MTREYFIQYIKSGVQYHFISFITIDYVNGGKRRQNTQQSPASRWGANCRAHGDVEHAPLYWTQFAQLRHRTSKWVRI